jgi:hypothetical protein
MQRKETFADKKIGVESSDPNRYSQPRLPGSVVGEPSMPRTRFPYKITEVIVPKLPSEKPAASSQKPPLLRRHQRMRNRMH